MAMDCRTCREYPAGVVGCGLLATRTYPHPDAHPNPFTPPHADAQPRSQPYANTHSHAHSHAYAHRCPNADPNRHPSAHARDRGGPRISDPLPPTSGPVHWWPQARRGAIAQIVFPWTAQRI